MGKKEEKMWMPQFEETPRFQPTKSFQFSQKGVIYAVLISVACFSLQQGLETTLTGRCLF